LNKARRITLISIIITWKKHVTKAKANVWHERLSKKSIRINWGFDCCYHGRKCKTTIYERGLLVLNVIITNRVIAIKWIQIACKLKMKMKLNVSIYILLDSFPDTFYCSFNNNNFKVKVREKIVWSRKIDFPILSSDVVLLKDHIKISYLVKFQTNRTTHCW